MHKIQILFINQGNSISCEFNGLYHIISEESRKGIIVCLVSLFLKMSEYGTGLSDIIRKNFLEVILCASISCKAMFKGAVNLAPCLA